MRLTATALLPARAKIDTIGGAGREFEVDGENFPLKRKLNDAYTSGAWRAEITGAGASGAGGAGGAGGGGGGAGRTRTFLTMLVPADVDAPREPDATVEQSPAGYLVRQGSLAVALVRPGRQITVAAPRIISLELAV